MIALEQDIPAKPRTEAPVARLEQIIHAYGGGPNRVEVLHGVHLDIRAGELTLLMGPSGSGKTTLLTILGLLRRPTHGRVELCGTDLSACSEAELTPLRRRHISFIFQSFNLLSSLSAVENVQLALDLQGLGRRAAAERATQLLDRVGLADRLDHLPAALSCGQQQRVAIARSLASAGELVLADEPTASLDSASAKVVMELLRTQADVEGRAVVVVTHDPRLERLADRMIRIEDGRIAA